MSNMRGFFITGTDTGVGKTAVTLGVMEVLKRHGLRVAGMKPVASGAETTREGLRNADAVAIQCASSIPLDYNTVNPYVFAPPVAPHLAAREAGTDIELSEIVAGAQALANTVDRLVVEGVGGWLVPLNAEETLADLAVRLRLPVILVVGMRLGCLNHSLLTYASIRERGLPLAGWVANRLPGEMLLENENIATLERRIPAPLIGRLPTFSSTPTSDAVAALLAPQLLC